jgi:hypothetical protein
MATLRLVLALVLCCAAADYDARVDPVEDVKQDFAHVSIDDVRR